MAEYIERDSTLKKMWNALYALEDKREQEQGLDVDRRLDIQDGFEAGQQAVVNMPAADVEPVKHGKWNRLDTLDKWQCSACGILMDIDGTPKENMMHFCLNCGAKMEESR